MTTRINHISKFYGDYQALIDINLEIQQGEFVAILGPSGCGKTTLLRLLAGFEQPSSGEIYLDDLLVSNQDQVLAPEERNIGMVFQNFALWPHLTVGDHIKFPLMYHRFRPNLMVNQINKRIEEVLESVGLASLADRLPGQLSGGQKQRVALARAIAPKPGLLLMDEPLSSLDAELRIEMRAEIQKLHQLTQSSIVYVTHDQSEALAMADRIIVMRAGSIEQVGTPYEIYYQPKTSFVANFVSKANLISGQWSDQGFRVQDTQIVWPDLGTDPQIKADQLYLLRPEEIELLPAEHSGLVGQIQARQFQGKELHYMIQLENQQTISVHTPISQQYDFQDWVSIRPKEGV